MELQKTEIGTIENIIQKTGIPYQGIKIELVDHLASEVERKMEANSRLSFEEALSRVSYNMKETILHLKRAMTKKAVKELITESIDLTNWMTISVVGFFSSMAFGMVQNLNSWTPITESYMIMTILAFIIMKWRIRRIDSSNNYKVRLQKRYAWIPLLAIGSVCLAVSLLFKTIMVNTGFQMINKMFAIPVALSYGFFVKAMLDVVIFNVSKLKEEVELDEIFDQYQFTDFELSS